MSGGNLNWGISLLYHGCYRSNHGISMYVGMSSNVYGKTIQKKSYAKMRGWNYVVQTRACSKCSFGILKRSAD